MTVFFSSDMRTCHPDYFQCGSGHCVPNQLKCDGTADCPDATDESTCRKFLHISDSIYLKYLDIAVWIPLLSLYIFSSAFVDNYQFM